MLRGKVEEIKKIKKELKQLTVRGKKLRQRVKMLEKEISDHLESKGEAGFKHNGMAVIRTTATRRKAKKKNEVRDDVMYVLEQHGVRSPERVYDEIMEARRGIPIERNKIEYKKYKRKDFIKNGENKNEF